MRKHAKSGITRPLEELELVLVLQKKLEAKSRVEVVRRGLRLLKETTDRESAREAYRRASPATRASLEDEMAELGLLVAEGLDEP